MAVWMLERALHRSASILQPSRTVSVCAPPSFQIAGAAKGCIKRRRTAALAGAAGHRSRERDGHGRWRKRCEMLLHCRLEAPSLKFASSILTSRTFRFLRSLNVMAAGGDVQHGESFSFCSIASFYDGLSVDCTSLSTAYSRVAVLIRCNALAGGFIGGNGQLRTRGAFATSLIEDVQLMQSSDSYRVFLHVVKQCPRRL